MEPNSTLIISIAHVAVLLVITALNIGLTQIRFASASNRDARRLRLAIRTELTEVLQLYRSNTDQLARKDGVLLSIRPFLAIYRGSLNRLNLLVDAEIPYVVAAYSMAESIEAIVAATAKANGTASYHLVNDETPTAELIAHYARGIDRTQHALVALGDRRDSVSRSYSFANPIIQPSSI